jgi:hypothetical protein
MELAGRVRALDTKALDEILARSDDASDDERRALAALASAYVRGSPEVFLDAQRNRQGCFGVAYLTVPDATENNDKGAKEIASRRDALSAVANSRLLESKSRCLALLPGS